MNPDPIAQIGERLRAMKVVELLTNIRLKDPALWEQIKEFAKFDGNVERHSTNREACKTEKELTEISSSRRLRVKGTDTDSSMGCRIGSGETGILASDGPSEDRPIAHAQDPWGLTRQQATGEYQDAGNSLSRGRGRGQTAGVPSSVGARR